MWYDKYLDRIENCFKRSNIISTSELKQGIQFEEDNKRWGVFVVALQSQNWIRKDTMLSSRKETYYSFKGVPENYILRRKANLLNINQDYIAIDQNGNLNNIQFDEEHVLKWLKLNPDLEITFYKKEKTYKLKIELESK